VTDEPHYHMVEVPPGGLLLDLRSGALVSLNASATAIWRQHMARVSRDAIADALATRYQISGDQARRDVETALDLAAVAMPAGPATEYRYIEVNGGYALSRAEEPVIQIDREGRFVSWCHADRPTAAEARSLLQSISPKIMSSRGQMVLHSSAALMNEGVIAFSGHGGAGKTTTARSLVGCGATLVSEDKLLMRIGTDGVDVVIDAEATIQAWARAAARELLAGRVASCNALALAVEGPTAPLREVGFIDASRRRGQRMLAQPLTRLQATWAVFYNMFHGSAISSDWKQQLETSATMVEHVSAYEVTTPDGLSSLAEATHEVARRGTLRS
jgi:hypothetical protein